MKALLSDIKARIKDPISNNELSGLLFQLGHENDIQDNIIDIDITPNRGDCLSLLGILRDLKNFYQIDTKYETHEEIIDSFNPNFFNECTESCPNISFLKIEIDKTTSQYEEYLENYFSELGNRKINLFTDISNYLSYELGQPTHCYDFSKISSEIVLKTLEENMQFETLTEKKVELSNSNLVFAMDNKIINLAGVMGGKETACSDSTTTVLVECAFFVPESIIGKSVKYDLNSEAAHRFERGVDPACQEFVLRRFLKIVSDHAKIKNIELYSQINKELNKNFIKSDRKKIENILGVTIEKEKFINILENLGFKIENENIFIPSYRNDIFSSNDIAEEIARVLGYDNLPSNDINLEKLSNKIPSKSVETFLRKTLTLEGFSEVINSPFVENQSSNCFTVDNPLDSNRNSMRTSLRESLINNLLYNERRQKDSVKFFEISDVYCVNDKKLVRQKKLGIIASGRIGNNYKEFSQQINKNYLNDILVSKLSVSDSIIENLSRENLDTKIKTPIFYTEIDLKEINGLEADSDLLKDINKEIRYKRISEFPTISRDISFLIKNENKIKTVNDMVQDFESKILKEQFIFDFYKDDKNGITKIGYRFIFQSNEKTLTLDEVDVAIKKVVESIISDDEIEVPGYS